MRHGATGDMLTTQAHERSTWAGQGPAGHRDSAESSEWDTNRHHSGGISNGTRRAMRSSIAKAAASRRGDRGDAAPTVATDTAAHSALNSTVSVRGAATVATPVVTQSIRHNGEGSQQPAARSKD